MKNTLKEINKLIDELLTKRATVSSEIENKLTELRKEYERTEAACKEAEEALDYDKMNTLYEKGQRIQRAIGATERALTHVSRDQIVTEEESDAVIAKLYDYQRGLDAALLADALKVAPELEKSLAEYEERSAELLQTAQTWTSSIHAKYRDTAKGREPVALWPFNINLPGRSSAAKSTMEEYVRQIRETEKKIPREEAE